MEDLSGRQLGTYKVLAPLGQGGMAAVYLALQLSVNRQVAVKILPRHHAGDAEFVARFRREVSILAMLKHPGVLSIIDFGESEGYTYIVMPLVEGGTLAGRLTGEPLPLDEVTRIIGQVGDALDYAHGKGVVHRDLKPSNILMDERGNCLLSDFGIARVSGGGAHLTMTGTQIGTPTYMSPEQAEGQPGGPASDIYSLGVVLYELVTGRVPFEGDTPIAIAVKHVTATVPPPRSRNPRLPADVEAVVLKALARAPGDRYATARDLVAALSTATAMRATALPRAAAERAPAHVDDVTVLSPRRDRTPAPPTPAEPLPPTVRRTPIAPAAPTAAPLAPAAAIETPSTPYWSAGRLIIVVGMLAIPLLFAVLALWGALEGRRPRGAPAPAEPVAAVPIPERDGGSAVNRAIEALPDTRTPEQRLWDQATSTNQGKAFEEYLKYLLLNPTADAVHVARPATGWRRCGPRSPLQRHRRLSTFRPCRGTRGRQCRGAATSRSPVSRPTTTGARSPTGCAACAAEPPSAAQGGTPWRPTSPNTPGGR
jgi:tRNA A-37 threonylcarbamoyl transferase component Bud32